MGGLGWLVVGFFAGFVVCLTPALVYDWLKRRKRKGRLNEPWTCDEDWR